MPPRKRGPPRSDSPRKRTKKTAPDPLITVEDEEDDLASILEQIKAQEESEALARHLQEEWNASGPSSSGAPSNSGGATQDHTASVDFIEVSNGGDQPEDDEAFARRLAQQWEAGVSDSDVGFIQLPSSQTQTHSASEKGKAKSDPSSAIPPIARLEQCRDLFVGEKTCACGAKLPSPRGHVVFTPQSPPPSLLRLLHVPCKKCNTNHCRGCMSPVSCPLTCKGEGTECSVQACCANVRVIAIFETLGGFDRQYLGERECSDERARKAAEKARQSRVGTVGPGGTGYGMGNTGTGYGPGYEYGYYGRGRGRGRGRGSGRGRGANSVQSEHPVTDALTSHFDELIVRALNTVTSYLPAPYADDPKIYDMLPHDSIDALLSLSQLSDLLGNLLRNDSVTDWITRIEVYHAMLALLRRMADCELTLEVLIGSRWEISKSCGLEDWMWGDSSIVWERKPDTDDPVPAPPLYAHFKKLTRQCEAFLAGASSLLESGAADDGSETAETAVKATSLCGDIIAAKDDIERAMAVMGKNPETILRSLDPAAEPATLDSTSTTTTGKKAKGKGRDKGKGLDPAINLDRVYARECERLAFKYTSLSQPSRNGQGLDYPGYNYVKEVGQTASATRNPKDRLHLVKELAVMATSLPPGVWVRVDDVRNDVMKIMIAGPEGTPYAGGLFEFDCFIPLEYPNKPPLMHLRTTGGGSVRFNPNLYNNGKVCLSLLGTWPGRPEEQWSPKSTLLQVLVSIQSMILIELPYFNEPGYGKANPSNRASQEYNKNIRAQTTRWAIVEWLKDEHKDGVWGEVIASHFLTRHDTIRSCLAEWAKHQTNIRKYSSSAGAYGGAYMSPLVGMGMPPPPEDAYSGDELDDLDGYGAGAAGMPYGAIGMATYPGGRAKSAAGAKPLAQINLLDEFDTGIQRVRGWKFADSEQA
ncbi:hypothetical protein L226DRAFT_497961 [Lentinus tigrinus ALCF2SS1-7]|uniref:UBC core domain-containing protein n=1 Tax=Lentinus tigrinus ALCF2SS1-6 TaxID=1328759 RepID=A0A5C2STQ3_9APHY|nr:hypothetical protein L227DRAFT_540884 [Lentinus tigrinus ALCF2SS1-6]RPD82813.1 hypothetical protein L226DRAFT_497961 [Lentinus tigrinus ALCF2SS1-7]